MKVKTIYLGLCVLGVVLPYWQFVPWLAANGLNMHVFFQQLFVNHISALFGMDVLVSALALLVFARSEGSRLGVTGRWLPLIAVLSVGVSLGFPLFLYMRERNLEQGREQARTAAV
jgi:hypothetical protein